MKQHVYKEPIYHSQVTAIYATVDELNAWTKRHGYSLRPGIELCDAAHFLDDRKQNVVWMKKPGDFYALLHETVHLVRSIFEERGMSTNLAIEDEHFAYQMGFWFRRLWCFFGGVRDQMAKEKK